MSNIIDLPVSPYADTKKYDNQADIKDIHADYISEYGIEEFLDFLADQFNEYAPLSEGDAKIAFDIVEDAHEQDM